MRAGIRVGGTDFTDRVSDHMLAGGTGSGAFTAWITDLTQGQAVIANGESSYYIEGE